MAATCTLFPQKLKAILDNGRKLPFPDGVLINGRGPNGVSFNVEQGILSNSFLSVSLICYNNCFKYTYLSLNHNLK